MLLCIETSLSKSSIALSQSNEVFAFKELQGTEGLAAEVELLLMQHAVAAQDLAGVAVSAGPGSYTGLRIGAALGKGLAFALDIPLYAVDTLKLMAKSIDTPLPKCPMIDARRMEVYTALLDDELNYLIEPVSWVAGEANFVPDSPVAFFGDGAPKCKELLKEPNWVFVQGGLPSAKWMPELAQQVDVAYFEPFYLKEYNANISKNPLEALQHFKKSMPNL